MDNDQVKEEEKGRGRKEVVVEVLAEGPDGLRRSTRLRNQLPPPSPPREGGCGSYSASASERKGSRNKEGGDGDAEDVKVNSEEIGTRPWKKVHGVTAAKGQGPSSVSVSSAVERSDGEMGPSEHSPREEEAHPCLSNENVLDVIFQHIVTQPGFKKAIAKDVQSIRQVCQIWKNSVTRVYRRTRQPTVFEKYADKRSQPRGRSNHDTSTLSHFMNVMTSSPMIPVQKFHLHKGVFKHRNLNLFQAFFRICGPEAVSLHISLESDDARKLALNLKALPDLNLPKLKALELDISDGNESQTGIEANKTQGLLQLVELLLTAPKMLQELEVSYWPHCCFPHQRKQVIRMGLLSPVISKSIPRTLKNLKLYTEMTESGFNEMAEFGLKLERFELGVPSHLELGDKTLHKFLQGQAATLKHLRIWNPSRDEEKGIFVQFPRLDELLYLELYDVVLTLLPRSSLGDAFPKLTCLELSRMRSQVAFRALLAKKRAPQSLKVLHLPVWRYGSLAPFVKELANCFPDIAELDLVLYQETKETMWEVFTYFDNLESLRIAFAEKRSFGWFSEDWAESVLSGISTDDCSDIVRRGDFGNEKLSEFRRKPSILNLTKLRKLAIRMYPCSNPVTLTDFLAHFVFLEMDNLREIHTRSPIDVKVLFSPRYAELMRKKLVVGRRSRQ